eukprot:636850-Amphidinium_carterae.1
MWVKCQRKAATRNGGGNGVAHNLRLSRHRPAFHLFHLFAFQDLLESSVAPSAADDEAFQACAAMNCREIIQIRREIGICSVKRQLLALESRCRHGSHKNCTGSVGEHEEGAGAMRQCFGGT